MFEILLNPDSIFFWIIIISIISCAVAIISRPFSTYIKFVYPNAKFEAIGNPYVQENVLNGIVESKNLSDFKESINTYKDFKIEGETAKEIQKSLDKSFIQLIEMMKKDSSKKMEDFFNIYIEKIDMYLVKKVIKNKILKIKINEEIIDKAILDNTKNSIKKIIESENKDIIEILAEYNFHLELSDSIENFEKNLINIDNALDKYIINKFKETKVPFKCEAGKQKFVKIFIDILNIKNVLRGKQLNYNKDFFKDVYLGIGYEIAKWKYDEISDVESVSQVISSLEGTSYYNKLKDRIEDYNKKDSVQIFENVLDCILLKQLKDISMQNYVTIGPTIRFLISKEFEIRNLKIISKGIEENLSSDIINQHLIKEVA